MSAEVPEAASAEEQKVSVHGERPRRLGRPGGEAAGSRACRAACSSRVRRGAPGVGSGRLVRRAGGACVPRPSRPSSIPHLLPAGTLVLSANVVGV